MALNQCEFDPEKDLAIAAAAFYTRGCICLGLRRPREAVRSFATAKDIFEQIHRPLDVALTASYSIEGFVVLKDYAAARTNANTALEFFDAAGCPQDSLEAIVRVQALLETERVDASMVAARVRQLAKRHGGWLPVRQEPPFRD